MRDGAAVVFESVAVAPTTIVIDGAAQMLTKALKK